MDGPVITSIRNEGTVHTWLAALVGPRREAGPEGPRREAGPEGPRREAGPEGPMNAMMSALRRSWSLSTALLALLGAEHTAITPDEAEVRRLMTFCTRYGIPTSKVRFEIGYSQDVLPALAPGELDLVLIDGSHAFPIPFIDWYFCASHLREGGLMLVDDIQLWTGRVLKEYLATDPGWRQEQSPDRAVVFRKVMPFDQHVSWVHQPFMTARSSVWRDGGWRPFAPAHNDLPEPAAIPAE
jgi:hypothetical protein